MGVTVNGTTGLHNQLGQRGTAGTTVRARPAQRLDVLRGGGAGGDRGADGPIRHRATETDDHV